jgi:NhaP-type Na+/H+ or K+/H+ antiporter
VQFFAVAIGGVIVGWVTGRLAMAIFARLQDTLLDIAVSILAGFAAYLGAEAVHASGVLAAVACGLVLGRQQHTEFTARTRLELVSIWGFVEFVLTSLVFVLIGLQLRSIIERLQDYDTWHLASLAVAVSATLIVSRFIWVFASAWVPRAVSKRLRETDPLPPWSHTTVISWTGMRGVVSLAAALALPEQFPSRDIILFLAFCSIFVTLVLQGTTLGWLIRRIGLNEEDTPLPEPDTAHARAEIATAALEAVKEQLEGDQNGEHTQAAAELVQEYEVRAERASIEGQDVETRSGQLEAQQRLRIVAIEAAREKLLEQTDVLDIEAHRALGEELDLEEQQIRRALGGG